MIGQAIEYLGDYFGVAEVGRSYTNGQVEGCNDRGACKAGCRGRTAADRRTERTVDRLVGRVEESHTGPAIGRPITIAGLSSGQLSLTAVNSIKARKRFGWGLLRLGRYSLSLCCVRFPLPNL